MIFETLLLIVEMIVLAIPCTVPILYFWLRNRRWVPVETSRSATIRRFESLALLSGLAVLGILWVYAGIPTSWMPRRFGDGVSAALKTYYFAAVIFGSAIGLVSVLLAWRVNTSITITSLLIMGLTGSIELQNRVNEQQSLEWQLKYAPQSVPKDATQIKLLPTKLRFELIDNLAGADFWLNGTYIGKTPYETTDQELYSKVRAWTKEEEAKYRNFSAPEDQFTTPQGARIPRWGWCPLHFQSVGNKDFQLYYRVDLNGKPGFSTLVSQTSKQSPENTDTTQVIRFDTVFPAWEAEIEELLDRARLKHYDVDAEWLTAFQTYGMFGTNRLNQALRTEPGLKRIELRRAQLEHQLQDVTDSATAWDRLMDIEAQARTARKYDSTDSTGLAVDLLVAFLDVEQLINHALKLLRTSPNPIINASYGPDRFATDDNGIPPDADEVALFPIAQAVWRLDQKYDAERDSKSAGKPLTDDDIRGMKLLEMIQPDRDNPIERRISPAIMRLSYPNEDRLKYAEILGGSAYERFLLRNDWRSPPDRNGTSPHIGDFENRVNPWFFKLLWLRSPVAAAFRQQQSQAILTIAKGAISEFSLNSGSFPQGLDFLFLDRAFTPTQPSLATKFWPQLDRLAGAAPKHAQQQTLQLRWDYLARMWPESKPEMFIEALKVARVNTDRLFSPQLPEYLSPTARFEILNAVLLSESARSAKLPDDPKEQQYDGPKQHSRQMIMELTNKLYPLPCELAAKKLLEDLAADPKHSWWDRLPDVLAYNTQNDDLLRLMVESSQPKLQRMILPAIEHFPTDTRQQLLAKLLLSNDESVRSAAAVVGQKLKELGNRPYPYRKD